MKSTVICKQTKNACFLVCALSLSRRFFCFCFVFSYPSNARKQIRVEDCTGSCESTPIAIDIVCGDGSGPVVPSPTPAPFTASDCDIVEVAGTLGASVDGYFYNDGSTLEDGVAQYIEYALVGDDLSR